MYAGLQLNQANFNRFAGGSGSSSAYVVPTLAALKALTARPATVEAQALVAGDGLGGTFDWYAGNTTTPDDIDVVSPSAGSQGRYIRRTERLLVSTASVSAAWPSSFGSTPTNIFGVNNGSFPTAGMIPTGVLQQYAAAMVVPASYTQQPWPNVNFGAYTDNQGTTSGQSTVNYFASAFASVNTPNTYSANFNGIVSNTAAANAYSASGSGNNFGVLINLEMNANIWKVSAADPSGVYDAIRLVGGGDDTRPTGGAFGFHAFPLAGYGSGSPTYWTAILYSEDGTAATPGGNSYFASMGATGPGNSVHSQAIQARARDGGGTAKGGYFQYQYTDNWLFTGAFVSDGASITSGVQQTTQGSLILANTAAGAYSTTLKSSNSASAAWTLTLPTTAGTADYALTTDGSGVTSWTNMRSLTTASSTPIIALANSAGTQSSISYSPNGQVSWYVGATIANANAFDWYDITNGANRMSINSSGILSVATFKSTTALITAVDGGSTAAFTANMVGSTGGPTTAAQNGWSKQQDSSGATIWLPVWK